MDIWEEVEYIDTKRRRDEGEIEEVEIEGYEGEKLDNEFVDFGKWLGGF